MSGGKKGKSKSLNADWFVQGALSRIGEMIDRLTGRGWRKASSLSTSELIERLKLLLDSEVRDLGSDGKFVPHHLKLKMQWNKFATDSDDGIKKLENELLASAIDHINDNLYHTYAPLKIEVKADYFIEGVKLIAGFGEYADDETEAELNVVAPQTNTQTTNPPKFSESGAKGETYIFEYSTGGKPKSVEFVFDENKNRMAVGRTKENDIVIEDTSVSKVHAALVLNPQKKLLVADTGSTNGTFINGNRIAYGRAFPLEERDRLKFGNVEVSLRKAPKEVDFATRESYAEGARNAVELSEQGASADQIPALPVAPLPSGSQILRPQQETLIVGTSDEEDAGNTQQHLVKLNFDE